MDIHQLLELIWTVLVWIFNPVEKLSLLLSAHKVSLNLHLILIVSANQLLIVGEHLLCHLFFGSREIRTPDWLIHLTRGRQIESQHLYICGALPVTQKIGVFLFHSRRHRLGWRGFVALSLGGSTRVAIYPFLPDVVIQLVIIILIGWGIVSFIQKNGRKILA